MVVGARALRADLGAPGRARAGRRRRGSGGGELASRRSRRPGNGRRHGSGRPGSMEGGEFGPGGMRGQQHWGMSRRGPGMRGFAMRRSRIEDLDLTDAQRKKLADIRDQHAKTGINQRASVQLASLELRKLMRAGQARRRRGGASDRQDRIAARRPDQEPGDRHARGARCSRPSRWRSCARRADRGRTRADRDHERGWKTLARKTDSAGARSQDGGGRRGQRGGAWNAEPSESVFARASSSPSDPAMVSPRRGRAATP